MGVDEGNLGTFNVPTSYNSVAGVGKTGVY